MNRTGQTLMVDATGTHRRLQALMALGWSLPSIAARLNDRGPNIRRVLLAPRLTRRFADRIAAVYEDMCMNRPVGHDRTSNAAIARTRLFAARRGWLPPLAWDDIDADPAPATAKHTKDIDEVAIDLAVVGHRVHLSPAERRICIRRLHAQNYSDGRIADTIGCSSKTVLRIREELGLPAVDEDNMQDRSVAA